MSNTLVKQIADYVRTYEFLQGDQYGTWIDRSPNAEDIARAIEANFTCTENVQSSVFEGLNPSKVGCL